MKVFQAGQATVAANLEIMAESGLTELSSEASFPEFARRGRPGGNVVGNFSRKAGCGQRRGGRFRFQRPALPGAFMSPRPQKPRRCHCPRQAGEIVFKPAAMPMSELSQVVLFHDEVEALLFCDEQGLTQEEAGVKMEISRGTVQRLVTSGRKKLIRAITTGQALIVEPGISGQAG